MAWNNYLKDQRSSPYISMLEGYGKNYMDPRGSQNMMMRDTYMQAGRENAGQQYREGMKMGAAGMNPFANHQYRSSLRDNTESAYRGYQSGMMQNQQMGQSMLGMGMQARMQQGQQEQQQKQWDREYRQHERGQLLTLGGTLASGLIQPGGLLGKAMPKTGNDVNIMTDKGDLTVEALGLTSLAQQPSPTTPLITSPPTTSGNTVIPKNYLTGLDQTNWGNSKTDYGINKDTMLEMANYAIGNGLTVDNAKSSGWKVIKHIGDSLGIQYSNYLTYDEVQKILTAWNNLGGGN